VVDEPPATSQSSALGPPALLIGSGRGEMGDL
jgi:hypothetical protein